MSERAEAIPLPLPLPKVAELTRTTIEVADAKSGTTHQAAFRLARKLQALGDEKTDEALAIAAMGKTQDVGRTLHLVFRTNIPFVDLESIWGVDSWPRRA